MWTPETLKAIATGIAAGAIGAVATVLVAVTWLRKFTNALDLIPQIQNQIATQTTDIAEAARTADAAHRRIDELREKHEALKNIVTTLDERTRNQGARIESIATQIMALLSDLNKKLDEAIRDGVIAGRKQ